MYSVEKDNSSYICYKVILNEYSFSDKNHKVYLSDSDNIGKENIRLQGYFQDWELYKDVDQIKSYFNIPDVEPNKDDLLLSLRINRDFNGDGSSTCMITDPQVLVKLVDELIGNYNSLTIIADVHNHHVFDMFKRFAPKVVCRDGRLPKARVFGRSGAVHHLLEDLRGH